MIAARHRAGPLWRLWAMSGCAWLAWATFAGPLPLAMLTQPAAGQQAGPPPPAAADARQAPAKTAAPATKSGNKSTSKTGKQGAEAGKGEAKTDAASAQSQVEAGINALEAGKIDAAVTSLSSGLSAGNLPAAQTARALYYRGIAYRKQAKPAQAIADLTSALWLKGALNPQQRADALENRAAAYREAGLPDQAPADRPRSAEPAGGKTSDIQTSSVPGAAAASTTGSGGLGSLFGSLFSGGSPPASAPAAAPAANKSWGATTEVRSASTEPTVTAAAAPPPGPAAAAQSVAAAAPQAAPPTTVKAPWAPITNAGAKPAATALAAPAAKAPTTGNYRLQVAAVRSNEEALSVASRLQERYGRELGGRSAAIDQTVLGNMGTIYRVKVGPYASATEPRALCERLKADGMDCLVVTQ